MPDYEYKSIKVESKFRDDADLVLLDKNINTAAEKGWELVSTTALATNQFDHGKTSAVILTFKRNLIIPTNT